MSRLWLENIPTDTEVLQNENQIHKTLLVKSKCDILKATQVELGQWKIDGFSTEHIGEGQGCISLQWVFKKRLLMVRD